jgi:enamine deaminase RidA (YjgF/YER057c/UK114 family)
MNNCKGVKAYSIKKDLYLYSKKTDELYDVIANECKLKIPLNPDTKGTLLHAIAVGNFVSPIIKNISTDFNNLIKYINTSKRPEFISILSQIDLNNLKTVGGKTPLDLAIAAGKNNSIKNETRNIILLFQKMLEEAIALWKNDNSKSIASTKSTSSLSNTISTNSKKSTSSTATTKNTKNTTSTSVTSRFLSFFYKNQNVKKKEEPTVKKIKEIVSVICSHESRIKCYLKKFGITDYTKDKIVKIEYYNDSVQKIKIGYSNVYNNMVEGINNNVKYIFYIFPCYIDDFYKSMKKDINSIIKNRGISSSNKPKQIQTIKNKSIKDMKGKLPENPNYLFSSDLMISADNIYNIYNKKIIILPCCHPISTLVGNKCNGGLSLKHYSNLEEKNYINLEYYKSFYKGKGQCRNTDFLKEAVLIIFKMNSRTKHNQPKNHLWGVPI